MMDSIAQLMGTNGECRFAYSSCAADTMEFLISDAYFGREPMPDVEAIRKTPESAGVQKKKSNQRKTQTYTFNFN
jgi:hypothetical protein